MNEQTTKLEMTGRAHNHLSSGFAKIEAKKNEERQLKQQVAEMEEIKEKEKVTAMAVDYLKEQGYSIEK